MIHTGFGASKGDAQKRQQQLERKRKSQANKAELAREIDDCGMLCAAVAFYLDRLDFHAPGRFVPRPSEETQATRKVRKHLKAARHLLGIFSRKDEEGKTWYRLPKNFAERLRTCTGANAKAFTGLNPHLEVDDSTWRFAEQNRYVLEGTQRYLNGGTHPTIDQMLGLAPAAKPAKQPEPEEPPTPYSQFIQHQVARKVGAVPDEWTPPGGWESTGEWIS